MEQIYNDESVLSIREGSLTGVFCKKGVLKNFAKFTGKHLCQNLFSNKFTGLKACNFIKKETLAQVFPCEFCEIYKNTCVTEHLRWRIFCRIFREECFWLLRKNFIYKKLLPYRFLKVELSPSKSCFICFNESSLKTVKNILFHLKGSCRKDDLIRKIRLIL